MGRSGLTSSAQALIPPRSSDFAKAGADQQLERAGRAGAALAEQYNIFGAVQLRQA